MSINNDNKLLVSVVIPIRNEERYIEDCLNSLLEQDFPKDQMEVILIDGMSEDNTVNIINEFRRNYPFIELLQNPKKIIPVSLNLAIKQAKGEFIIRMDAHSWYASDYISKCIEFHQKVNAENIGGPTLVKGNNPCQRAVAAAYYSSFALGGGKQHIKGYEGYSDTVSFGSFKKETAENLGCFDERLIINEDDDFNFRLIKSGGKVFITPEIKSVYYPRDSYTSLFKQYFRYGFWKVAVIKKHKRPARISHIIPLLFFLFLTMGLIGSLLFSWIRPIYLAVILLYLLLNGYFSFKNKHIVTFSGRLRLVLIHFILHFSYGIGFFCGIFKFINFK